METVGMILLFILSLSCLIIIHELGHLLVAKTFKVYCHEFSIGFGPKIISKKRKNKETTFSLRALPLGGFVSMYGEEGTLPDGVEVDPKRNLYAIKKWKRGLVFSAGVIMNAILSLILFFCSEAFFVQKSAAISYVTVIENSQAEDLGMDNSDPLENPYKALLFAGQLNESMYVLDDNATISYKNPATPSTRLAVILNVEDFSFNNMSYDDLLEYRLVTQKGENELTISSSVLQANDNIDEIKFSLTQRLNLWEDKETIVDIKDGFYYINNIKTNVEITTDDIEKTILNTVIFINENNTWSVYTNNEETTFEDTLVPAVGEVGERYNNGYRATRTNYNFIIKTHINSSGSIEFDSTGLSMYLYQHKNTYKEAVKNTFTEFGENSLLIFKTIGRLFTSKEARQSVGGIISIGVQSSRTLKNFGLSYYVRLWAVVSVNLAIMNLLPIPGLDGWHLLVLFVEGVFKKKMSNKVKTIMSYIGFALLATLMVVILVKDVLTYL